MRLKSSETGWSDLHRSLGLLRNGLNLGPSERKALRHALQLGLLPHRVFHKSAGISPRIQLLVDLFLFSCPHRACFVTHIQTLTISGRARRYSLRAEYPRSTALGLIRADFDSVVKGSSGTDTSGRPAISCRKLSRRRSRIALSKQGGQGRSTIGTDLQDILRPGRMAGD